MSACVGWHAEPECPLYGDMHGCRLPDGHAGANHVCVCGQQARAHRTLARPNARNGAVLQLCDDGRWVTVDEYPLGATA
jgi:hypothetical protein